MEDKILSDIFLTEEYSQFKFLKGNRKIGINRNLEKSILDKGILKPIAVNSNMEIIDGQHRFSIAKNHNLPIPYYVTITKNLDEIIELNNTSVNWTIKDYINKYVHDGNEIYIELDYFLNKYPFVSTSDLIYALAGNLRGTGRILEQVKNGAYQIKDSTNFTRIIESYSEFVLSTQFKPASILFLAYFNLATIEKFDNEWFVRKANEQDLKRKILGIRKIDRVLQIYLETYNHNLMETKSNYINYRLTTKRTIELLEPRLDYLINYD